MNIRFFSAATVLFLTTAAASADIYADEADACRAALASNNQEAFQKSADAILAWRSVFNTQAILTARDCLNEGLKTIWQYDTPSGRFVLASDLEKERLARQEREQLAADRARQEAAALRIAEAEAERRDAALQTLYAQRRAQVQLAVVSACNELFEDDKIQALTNPVCIEVFSVRGLPTE